MTDNVILWLWLKLALKDRSIKTYKVYSEFGSIEAIYNASREEFKKLDYLDESDIEALADKNTSTADYTLHLCESNSIGIVTIDEERYPALLREIDNPPCTIFYFGAYDKALSKPCITIVGTRNCTTYGEVVTSSISTSLAKSGFSIVCGVARGIDSVAIESAVKANGSVIAVLPDGLIATKYSTKFKFKNIQYNGVAISEHLPKEKTHKFSYYERNRILSGLSLGTIITQAPEKSGALITAGYAADQGRDVFAVPANIDILQSMGSNKLIKDGAHPIFGFTDVFEHYSSILGEVIKPCNGYDFSSFYKSGYEIDDYQKAKEFKNDLMPNLDKNEQSVLKLIGEKETDINYIFLHTQLDIAELTGILSDLEAKGIIVSCPGNRFKISL